MLSRNGCALTRQFVYQAMLPKQVSKFFNLYDRFVLCANTYGNIQPKNLRVFKELKDRGIPSPTVRCQGRRRASHTGLEASRRFCASDCRVRTSIVRSGARVSALL